ncbi:hypothetical protein ACX84U_29635, partial [Burkholderia pseudomallei]
MMHGATVAAAAFIAFALFATDCAASGPPAGTDPAPGGAFAERFDHAPLTAPRVVTVAVSGGLKLSSAPPVASLSRRHSAESRACAFVTAKPVH